MTKPLKTTNATPIAALALAFALTGAAHADTQPYCPRGELTLAAVHRLPDAVVADTDPDWLTVIETRANEALKNGEWADRMKAEALRLRRWATDPTLPPSPLPARKTTLKTKPTGFAFGLEAATGKETLSVTVNGQTRVLPSTFPVERLSAFARHYLFLDATRPTEVAFARLLEEEWGKALGMPANLRVVLTGGSVRDMTGLLKSRVFADQGAVLTRRFGLNASPALVRLTAKDIVTFSPALNADGLPDTALPPKVTGLERPLRLDTRGTVRFRFTQPSNREE